MLRSALVTIVALAAAVPAVQAQEDPAGPLTLEQARERLDTAIGRWRVKTSEERLEAWLGEVRTALTERSAPELRTWLREGAVPALRPNAVTRKKLKSSRVKGALIEFYLALLHGPATDDALDLVDHWQKKTPARATPDPELVALMLPLADMAVIGSLQAPQQERFYQQMRWMARNARAALPDALPAFERAGERRYVELLTNDARTRAVKLGADAPYVLRRLAESLGRWWNHPPQLDLRVPALLQLAKLRDDDVQRAARTGLDRMLLGWRASTARTMKQKILAQRATLGSDGDLLAALLRQRREQVPNETLAAFSSDLGSRLDAMKRRDTTWATPVFIAALSWMEPPLATARGSAMTCLQFTRDRSAVALLVQLLKGVENAAIRAQLLTTTGTLSHGENADPGETVRAVLLQSVRTGQPLDRTAAAQQLGLLRITDAVDPIIAFGDGGGYTEQVAAWQALARIGGAKATTALLTRFDEGDDADRLPLVLGLGDWHALPLPGEVAARVGIAWDTPANLELRAAAIRAAVARGLAHPELLPRIRALVTDPASTPVHAATVLEALTTVVRVAGARPVLLAVLAAGQPPEREDPALDWLEQRPAADLRPVCLTGAEDATRRRAVQLRTIALLGNDAVWDPTTCAPVLMRLLRTSVDDHDRAEIVRDALDGHPMAALVPELIAMLPRTVPNVNTERDRASHCLAVREVLRRWSARIEPARRQAPLTMPATRTPWSDWWRSATRAGVTFR